MRDEHETRRKGLSYCLCHLDFVTCNIVYSLGKNMDQFFLDFGANLDLGCNYTVKLLIQNHLIGTVDYRTFQISSDLLGDTASP